VASNRLLPKNKGRLGVTHAFSNNLSTPLFPRNKREKVLPGIQFPTVNQVGTTNGGIYN
jgi:hypothetical protein